ncbi:MAG: ABC transporter substrate-binding protein [Streptomyces sp.]|nr:ABC transporter substrate-binding protein [Streptomyces sp.]
MPPDLDGAAAWSALSRDDGNKKTPAATGPVHTIALHADLSGDHEAVGRAQEQGLRLAGAEFNAGRNKPFKLAVRAVDGAGDPARAPAVAKELVADSSVVAVIGLIHGRLRPGRAGDVRRRVAAHDRGVARCHRAGGDGHPLVPARPRDGHHPAVLHERVSARHREVPPGRHRRRPGGRRLPVCLGAKQHARQDPAGGGAAVRAEGGQGAADRLRPHPRRSARRRRRLDWRLPATTTGQR